MDIHKKILDALSYSAINYIIDHDNIKKLINLF